MNGARLWTSPTVLSMFVFVFVSPAISHGEETHEPQHLEFFEAKVRPLFVQHCYECHSQQAKEPKGGLQVDSRAHLLKGGDSGPSIVPGDVQASLLVSAVKWTDLEMPPGGKLKMEQIDVLERWVQLGAPWPDEGLPVWGQKNRNHAEWRQQAAKHWSFQPISEPLPPDVHDKSWVKSPLDLFIRARLESAELDPSPPANAVTLLRRMYFDLLGIPPTPEQIDRFQAMADVDLDHAVVRVIDSLLASPRYGQRWGRHWLDVARYSDGHGGFLDNSALPHAWQYRDWVIDSLNFDLPFDEFVRLQIAGDLIAGSAGAVATGFFAIGPTYKSDGGDPDSIAQAEGETLDDRIDTLSRGLMALTVSCARCHDHKFDPIPQMDYYSLAGVFKNSGSHLAPLADASVVAAFDSHQANIKAVKDRLKQHRKKLKDEGREPTEEEKKQTNVWQAELKTLEQTSPAPYPVAHALIDQSSSDMPVAIRGNLRRQGETAPRRFLQALTNEDDGSLREGSGRLGLANAIADSTNPLTARVFVNRVWMHHFGRSLVRTPSNFGALGQKPTHPQLLDWLASRFIESGWSLKHLHRIILTSAAYQLSSRINPHNMRVDADNRLLWRMNPRRLDVEAWRDSVLYVTKSLDSILGGPPVAQINSPRRTTYLKVSRNGDQFETDRFLRLFDFPIMRATVAARDQSTVPPQYLFLMNNPFIFDQATRLATRLRREFPEDEQRIDRAYRLLYGRLPTKLEQKLGLRFLSSTDKSEASIPDRWIRFAQVLICSNEFLYCR